LRQTLKLKVKLLVCGRKLAKQMPDSPLADATPDDVALEDGLLVRKQDTARAVSIVDAMRHGGVDRIEQENATTFPDDGSHAHNTHSAIFAEVKAETFGFKRASLGRQVKPEMPTMRASSPRR